jgi:hypothetical protein
MLNTYVIEGGIGKCTAFTALIPKLAEKAGEGIQIYTPYIDCFAFNPNVAMAFEQSLPLTRPEDHGLKQHLLLRTLQEQFCIWQAAFD